MNSATEFYDWSGLMTRIEEVEQLLNDWKALLVTAQVNKSVSMIRHWQSGVGALETALKILKRPSNT